MKNSMKLLLFSIALTVLTLSITACKNDNEENQTIGKEPIDKPLNTTSDAKLTKGDYDYSLLINGSEHYEISDMLYGLFLEDINFAIDGGMYAEKIKNRSFEYGDMALNKETHGWSILDNVSVNIIDGNTDDSFLNENNPNYARVTNSSDHLAGIGNNGFLDGLSVEESAIYNFSGYFRSMDEYQGSITIRLQDEDGNIFGETTIEGIKNEWWKFETELIATGTISKGLILYVLMEKGTVDMDMISLFPKDTYRNRENGIRKDIAEALEALSPKFLRFPGGCVVEGETLHNAYDWKKSIGNGMEFMINGEVTYGDIATRPLAENIWGNQNSATKNPYYMTYGIGFYEYFLLSEDLGAEPIPIVNAGLSCLIQGTKSTGTPAQSYEIETPEFNQYVQDALDLVEFANGDADTQWGAIRIAMGHEAPFHLTYIGIGNEQWGTVYFSRYEAFQQAFENAAATNPDLYGGIELIVANGPVASDTYAWNKIKLYGNDYAGLVDEHYYMTPTWFLLNTHRYDTYDRDSVPVFLGEYAAQSNHAEAALAEAAYMTGIERNGDIVSLASYAPLFGNSTQVQWTPDMIWFNNNSLWGSANYYVQKIFSNNKSSRIIDSTLTGTSFNDNRISGKIGVGTWMTSATFDHIKVVNNDTNEELLSDDFSTDSISDWTNIQGQWSIEDDQLIQSNTGNPINALTGDVIYIGDENWTNYTLTVTATKTAGSEGFLIPIAVKDKNNSYHWNIGGWNNTISCLEQISAGTKSGQIGETVKNIVIETGQEYEIKIIVKNNKIICYLDGKGMVNYTIPQVESIYQVTGTDENGDLIIKVVNVSSEEQGILIQTNDVDIMEGSADVSILAAESLADVNTATDPEKVTIKDNIIDVSKEFVYTAPKYSVSVIRIPTN